jgi:hypothetical protein
LKLKRQGFLPFLFLIRTHYTLSLPCSYPEGTQMIRLTLLLSALLLQPMAAAQQLPTIPLTIRFFQVTAEVAQTHEHRAKGLMGRKSLPVNHGMLFIFEQADK